MSAVSERTPARVLSAVMTKSGGDVIITVYSELSSGVNYCSFAAWFRVSPGQSLLLTLSFNISS